MVVRRKDDSPIGLRQHEPMPLRRALSLALLLVAGAALTPNAARAETTTQLDQVYGITATLDVGAGRLDAVEELEITNRSAAAIDHVNLSVVPRALGFLTMNDPITVDGDEVVGEWTTTINLRLPLPDLARGDTASVRVPFRLDLARAPDAFTARTSADAGVLSFGQWFPIVSTEHDVYGLGDPQISFTADEIRLDLTTTTPQPRDAVACPGLESAPEAQGTTWTCVSTDVRDFSFVVNPRFRLTERTVDGTALRVYTETVDGAATADLAQQALIGLAEAFGPYPWADLVLAEVGSGGGFSMEYPRMIHLTRGKVADQYVVYHEVAHQWFYAQLGNEQQAEPWLDEGFADFAARYLMGIGENQCSAPPGQQQRLRLARGPDERRRLEQLRRLLPRRLLSRHRVPHRGAISHGRRRLLRRDARLGRSPPIRVHDRRAPAGSPPVTHRCGSRPDLRRLPGRLRGGRPEGIANHAPIGLVRGRQRDEDVGDRIGHLLERGEVDVVDRVAGPVAARIRRLAGDGAERGRLRIGDRLDAAAEQAAGRDPGGPERTMVGVAGEVDRLPRQSSIFEVGREGLRQIR